MLPEFVRKSAVWFITVIDRIAFLVGVGGRVFWCISRTSCFLSTWYCDYCAYCDYCDYCEGHSLPPPLAAPLLPQGRVVSILSLPAQSRTFQPGNLATWQRSRDGRNAATLASQPNLHDSIPCEQPARFFSPDTVTGYWLLADWEASRQARS